jgi:hypothetical protein
MTQKRITHPADACPVVFGLAFGAALTLAVFLMLAATAAMAQTGGGATLLGTVKDATGSVVTAATVKVVNTETSFLTQTTTQPDGSYYIPYLTPGNYRVTVNAPGFKEFVRDGLMMRSAEAPRVDLALEVGSVSDSVTVNAAASLLNTETVVTAYVVLHGSFDDRYLPGNWTHRAYLTQFPTPPNAPRYCETFDLVGSGPVVISKIYNGRNKTFWLSDYDINHEHTINCTQTTMPAAAMLNGDFSFPEAQGGGLPIYNPYSYRQTNGTWTADPLPGNIVPKSLMDPVATKFLTLGIWAKPNQPGTPSRTGPSNNLQSVES